VGNTLKDGVMSKYRREEKKKSKFTWNLSDYRGEVLSHQASNTSKMHRPEYNLGRAEHHQIIR
jgi:hypothetical protein